MESERSWQDPGGGGQIGLGMFTFPIDIELGRVIRHDTGKGLKSSCPILYPTDPPLDHQVVLDHQPGSQIEHI